MMIAEIYTLEMSDGRDLQIKDESARNIKTVRCE